VPPQCRVAFEMGERVVVDGEAQVIRFTVTPWQEGWERDVEPRLGLDPEIAEWSSSPFWSAISYNQRLRMIEVVAKTILIPLECDCLGYSRQSDFLTEDFRAECDARRERRKRPEPGTSPLTGPPPVDRWGRCQAEKVLSSRVRSPMGSTDPDRPPLGHPRLEPRHRPHRNLRPGCDGQSSSETVRQ
jgi:hypothetical protein